MPSGPERQLELFSVHNDRSHRRLSATLVIFADYSSPATLGITKVHGNQKQTARVRQASLAMNRHATDSHLCPTPLSPRRDA